MNNGSNLFENRDIISFLEEVVGEEGVVVVRELLERGEASDDELAEKLKIKINVVRRILYKLYEHRLVSYTRTRDKEIGWYTYIWKLDLSKIWDVIRKRKKKALEDLMRKLNYERNNIFFRCRIDNLKIPYDIASERSFRCPQCEGELVFVDNSKIIRRLEEEIERLEKEIESLGEEKKIEQAEAKASKNL